MKILRTLILLFGVIGTVNSADQNWYWNQPNAKVKATGNLEWQPKPFVFEKGNSLKYIDFEKGIDNNPGTKEAPFKHHPWDPQAAGNSAACEGVHTYIFKRGVVYRGMLKADESGKDEAPIRLTSDPSWGTGDAVIAGSEAVTGWKKGVTNKDIPEKDKVWYAELNFCPRNVWMVGKDGQSTRIPLARTPNWKVSNQDDVKSEWWHWTNPKKHFDNFINDKSGKKQNLGIDTEHIKGDPEYFKDAVLWSEYGWVMGTPYPTPVLVVDMKQQGLGFSGQWGGGAGNSKIIRSCRYFLEDKPHYLDDPNGEFWFQKKGSYKGTLFIRLPGDQDPNTVHIEAGKYFTLIDSENMSNIAISGLAFRYTNTWWDLPAGPWVNKDVDPACIRLLGSGKNITIKNCKFEDTTMAVRVKAPKVDDAIDKLEITDCEISRTDHGGILLEDGGGWGKKDTKIGRLFDVKVLRNKFEYIGMRPNRFAQGHCLVVDSAETLEVAGNFLNRCYGSGIHIFGAKRSALAADRPLSRILIHHNKVVDPMLNTNDWGGIETWQGGPMYVYNNISGNPGGYWNWKYKNHPNEPACGRFGHAYYLDGAYKNYHFNNIAWGKSKDPLSPLGNTSAFQEIHSYQNTFSNNTVYNFVIGSRRQAPHAGRNKFLSNVWDAIGHRVFRHSDPAKSMAEANAKDAGEQKSHFSYETNAYSQNIFHDVAKYGVFESSGRWLDSIDDFKNSLKKHQSLTADLGNEVPETPLMDPAKHDFRLKPNSPAIDKGSKVFVPWSLYAMVGEWNFYPAGNDPTRIMDEHWYMTPDYTDRQSYSDKPMFPLKGINITAADYVQGPLEDWTKGALKLNGKDQYAVLSNAVLDPVKKKAEPVKAAQKETFDWLEIDTPETLTPGKTTEVKVKLKGVPDGHIVQTDVHWIKKGGAWGGMNSSAGRHTVKGPGPYTFKVKPVDKPGLEGFELVVFATKDGSWKGRTNLARQKISAKVAIGFDTETLRSPQIKKSSFLIEAYLKCEPGKSGVVMEKMKGNGYSFTINSNGGLTLDLKAVNGSANLAGKAKINDGKWHHVVAECDRKSKTLNFYIDGKKDASGAGIGNDVDLTNAGDLYVGGTPAGRCLAGTFDFLRISQGTLADAKTNIEELYSWQFDGPFLRDFTGHKPVGPRRDAGALEFIK